MLHYLAQQLYVAFTCSAEQLSSLVNESTFSHVSQPAPSSSSSEASASDPEEHPQTAAEKLQEALNKPCRACTSTRDIFAAFHSQFSQQTGSKPYSTQQHSPEPNPAAISESTSSTPNAKSAASQPSSKEPFWDYEDEMPCPPDILELGHATWTLLHAMAAYYPEKPSLGQQAKMLALIEALGDFYPCTECAAHMRKELRHNPPKVSDNKQLSQWMCELHNEVNERLGRPKFDCSKVFERWRDGPEDGSCGPTH
eukprot:jgi/Chrzof1/13336/Cz07g29100.t1